MLEKPEHYIDNQLGTMDKKVAKGLTTSFTLSAKRPLFTHLIHRLTHLDRNVCFSEATDTLIFIEQKLNRKQKFPSKFTLRKLPPSIEMTNKEKHKHAQ